MSHASRTTDKPKPPVYDRLASRYERAIAPLERRLLTRLRARMLSALPVDARLLEIGAGTGLNFPFYPHGASGVASDLSAEMLRIARDKKRPPEIVLARHRAERLPYADDAFDAALATLVFCSVVSPAEGFAELRRVVRKGGTVALLEHVRPPGLLGSAFDALSLLTVPLFDDHCNRRTADDARRAGLELVRIEPHALGIIQLIVCRV